MSTLAVVVDWTGAPDLERTAHRMVSRLSHRSPDGMAVVGAPGAALGFGKLLVSHKQGHAHQPIVDREANLYVVADARIDNRDDLRRELGLPPVRPGTKPGVPAEVGGTDGDIVLAGYKKWGPLVPDHLVGDFAFAVWDGRERRLFAARDPFGVRPLYYRRLPGRLLVASDVEQILEVDETAWKIDDRAVVDYLLWRWQRYEQTFFEGIKAVPPGSCLMGGGGRFFVHRWWRPFSAVEPIRKPEDAREEFRALFIQAVASCMESDYPILSHVSGGFDSSLISLLAGEIGSRAPLRAVGAIHPGLACDESRYMEAVKRRLPYPAEFWDGTKPQTRDLDDPRLAGPSLRSPRSDGTFGDLEIARRQRARVLLSGNGGDVWQPLMSLFRDHLKARRWRLFLRHGPLSGRWSWAARVRITHTTLRLLAPSSLKRVLRRRQPACPPWLAVDASELPEIEAAQGLLDSASNLGNAERLSMLSSSMASNARSNMQNVTSDGGLEGRMPFLNARLVNLLWRIPLEIWGAPGYMARFHRSVFASVYPPELHEARRKTTYTCAVEHVVRHLAPQLWKILADVPDLHARRWIRPAILQGWLRSVLAGKASHGSTTLDWGESRTLWSVAKLEVWAKLLYSSGR